MSKQAQQARGESIMMSVLCCVTHAVQMCDSGCTKLIMKVRRSVL